MRNRAVTTVLIHATLGLGMIHGQPQAGDRNFTPEPVNLPAFQGTKWAILVGVDDYHDPTIQDLHCADADAHGLSRLLVRRGGYHPDHVFTLTTDSDDPAEAPTTGNLRELLARVGPKIGAGDMVVLCFSGHGLLDREKGGYLILRDCDPDRPFDTSFPMAELQTWVKGCKAGRKAVVLDCCRNEGKFLGQPSATPAELARPFRDQKGTVVMASCAEGQRSREWRAEGHGLFTFYLLDGLRGAADANGDRLVTTHELMAHARPLVIDRAEAEFKEKQTPTFITEDSPPNFALAYVGRVDVTAWLREAARIAGGLDDPVEKSALWLCLAEAYAARKDEAMVVECLREARASAGQADGSGAVAALSALARTAGRLGQKGLAAKAVGECKDRIDLIPDENGGGFNPLPAERFHAYARLAGVCRTLGDEREADALLSAAQQVAEKNVNMLVKNAAIMRDCASLAELISHAEAGDLERAAGSARFRSNQSAEFTLLAQGYCWKAAALVGDAEAAGKHRRAMEAARANVAPIPGFTAIARRRAAVLAKADTLKAEARELPLDDNDADAKARLATSDPNQRVILRSVLWPGKASDLARGYRRHFGDIESSPQRSLGFFGMAREVARNRHQDHFALHDWIRTLTDPCQRAGALAGGAAVDP